MASSKASFDGPGRLASQTGGPREDSLQSPGACRLPFAGIAEGRGCLWSKFQESVHGGREEEGRQGQELKNQRRSIFSDPDTKGNVLKEDYLLLD